MLSIEREFVRTERPLYSHLVALLENAISRGELPSGLQEMAHRWRSGRMADLGFADPWEALEVYRELDPAAIGPVMRRAR